MNPLTRALRSLRKNPGFTLAAILSLGLGIGLNTTMVSLLDALLRRLAPFAEPEQLLRIEGLAANGAESGLSVPEMHAITAELEGIASTIPFRWVDVALSAGGDPTENYVALSVTPDFFPGFGVPPALGRTLGPDDFGSREFAAVVIGHDLWQARFGGDPDLVGRTVRINGRPVVIAGIMPPAFNYRMLWAYVELWVPGTFMQDRRGDLENRQYSLVARLRPDTTQAMVEARLRALAQRLALDHPHTHAQRSLRARPLHESTVSPTVRRLSLIVTGLSWMILLIICANLANLQLTRALGRARDFAIGAALGATRWQQMAGQVAESLALGLAGGALGCLLAVWANAVVSNHLVVGLAGRLDLRMNTTVLLTSLAASILAALLVGVAPAVFAARTRVADALRRESRGATGSPAQRRVRQALIIGELALALVLLTGAGILTAGFARFLDRDPGWDREGVIFGTVALPRPAYDSIGRRREFHARLEQNLLLHTGVTHAALSSLPPLASYWTTRHFQAEDRMQGDGTAELPFTFYVPATAGYFEAMRIPFIEGRAYSPDTGPDDPRVVVINETFARALWPGQSAVGRRLVNARGDDILEIVGVVRDVEFPASVDEPLTRYHVYRPLVHDPWNYTTIAVRGSGGSDHLIDVLRRTVAQLDPEVPVQQLTDVPSFIRREQRDVRVIVRVIAAFAFIGLGLAAFGVFSITAQGVAQRRRELAIRLALGARPGAITASILRHGLGLALAGTLVGAVGAWGLLRVLESALPRLTEASPGTFALVAGVLGVATLLGSWAPARQAATTDPATALRGE